MTLSARRVLIGLSPLLGLGVVGLALWKTGVTVQGALGLVPFPLHIGAMGAFLLSLLGRGARIALLARGMGARVSLGQAMATQLTGEAAAAVTPSRSGSDPARILYLKKLGLDVPTGIAILAGEIMAEGLVLASLILLLVFLLPGHRGVVLGALPYAMTSLAVPLTAFFFVRRPRSRTPPPFWNLLRLGGLRWRKVRAGVWRFRSRARALARLRSGTVLGVLVASLLHMLARLSLLPILVAGTVGGGSPAPLVAWPLLLLYTGSLLPPPGGGGAVELAFVAGLTPVLGQEPLAGTLLWWRFYTFYLGASAGALIFLGTLGRAGLRVMAAPRAGSGRGGATAVPGGAPLAAGEVPHHLPSSKTRNGVLRTAGEIRSSP